jgi:hypothetical protein
MGEVDESMWLPSFFIEKAATKRNIYVYPDDEKDLGMVDVSVLYAEYFSPVTAAVESAMAIPVPSPDAPPHPWTLIQGWRQQWRGGHTFLIVDHHAATDKVLMLESNSAYGLDGVGYREIGTLRDKGITPPAQWWTLPKVWTWRQVCSTYLFHEQAWLKVKDRKLTGLE